MRRRVVHGASALAALALLFVAAACGGDAAKEPRGPCPSGTQAAADFGAAESPARAIEVVSLADREVDARIDDTAEVRRLVGLLVQAPRDPAPSGSPTHWLVLQLSDGTCVAHAYDVPSGLLTATGTRLPRAFRTAIGVAFDDGPAGVEGGPRLRSARPKAASSSTTRRASRRGGAGLVQPALFVQGIRGLRLEAAGGCGAPCPGFVASLGEPARKARHASHPLASAERV